MIKMFKHFAEIDSSLEEKLREKTIVPIIIEFFGKPKPEQIKKLKDMGVKIDNVFKVSPLASGLANPEQIEKMRRLPYIKKIWLDSTVEICLTEKRKQIEFT